MVSSGEKVLVFGPTGAVGSTAALEAHRRGANVFLAMRDPKKPIKGLDDSEGYTRIQADLSDPETVTKAIETSGAKTVFVYMIHESKDNMASTFRTMKDAGIQHVVLLSSFTIKGAPEEEANMVNYIPRVHAQTEIALRDSGIPYTAVRPMYFNSNIFWNLKDIKEGFAELYMPDHFFDYLSPSDIGTVCGAILANPELQKPINELRIVELCGPELFTQREAFKVLSEGLGREIRVKELNEQEFRAKVSFMPPPVLDSLVNGFRASQEGKGPYAQKGRYEAAVNNLRRYKGGEPMQFSEWVEANKAAFA